MRSFIFYPTIIIALIITNIYRIKINSLTKKGDLKKRDEYIHKVTTKWAKFVMKLSGANITIIAITPYGINIVNIQFNIFKCKISLNKVTISIKTIPFNSCQTLVLLEYLINLYTKPITIVKSKISMINLSGFSFKYQK